VKVQDWERVAPGWERQRERTQASNLPVSQRMVQVLDPQPGWTVLELAAGPGDTGFLAASAVARLISTDFAPGMVEAARRHAAELGIENAEFRVMDAGRIELPDASVDGVLCRFGYMLMDDPASVLAETRRVLRPGGRLSFAVWAEARRNPWASTLGRILLERGHVEPSAPGEPGMFALAEPERIAEVVRAGGFSSHTVEEVPLRSTYAGVDDFWDVIMDLSAITSVIVAALAAGERAAVRAELAERLEQFREGDELVLPGLALVVVAS
jgi:SAM-dependent methyltransferase